MANSTRYRSFFFYFLLSTFYFLLSSGCAGKRMNFEPKPDDPIYAEKKEFYDRYFRRITPAEGEQFVLLATTDEFKKFEKDFWKRRDTDPNTPENEEKDRVDGYIRDIENEIFAKDLDIPQTLFSKNGGLKGEMAHVYLLYGAPNYKNKISEDTIHVDLMVWYYIDIDNRVLMAFLFYQKYDQFRIFRNQEATVLDIRFALKEISRLGDFMSDEDYQQLWNELLFKDPERAFISAMTSFSDYTHIDKDTRWTVDKALEAPEPAALAAERFKSVILGQPDVPKGTELFESGYRSFMPAYLRTSAGSDDPTFLMIIILRKNLDWVKQENVEKPYATNLNLRISFQNKKTRKLTEFVSYFKFELSQEEFDKEDDKGEMAGVSVVLPVALEYFDGDKLGPTLGETLKQLEPGEYVVNTYLQHTITKKYNTWREEIRVNY